MLAYSLLRIVAAPETILTGGTAGFWDMFGIEYWCHDRFFRFSSRGDSSPESDSEQYDESEAVELIDRVLFNFSSDSLWVSISPFIVMLCSSTDAVSEAVVDDGTLCVDEPGDGGDESLCTDSWVSEDVRGNNEDAFGLETDLRRRVLYVGFAENLTERK